jgi:hypothetical protein
MSKLRSLIWLWPLVLLLIVFWEPLTTSRTLFHPDWAPYFEAGSGAGFYERFVCHAAAPSVMNFLWAALPVRMFHIVFYPFCVIGICLAMYAFLRDRNLPRVAGLTGAIAIGFSGYMLTLVSAGHRGLFEVVLTSAITLFCIDRAVRGGGIWYFVSAGVVTSFSLGMQPDVLAMIGMFLAAYGVVACWMHRAVVIRNHRQFLVGLVVGLVVLAVTGISGLDKVRNSFLPGRQAIERREIPQADTTDADAAGATVAKARKWEFCTNWSLPPRDALELVLPLFFGTETTDKEAPFWGELGQSLGWTPGGNGFRNFRQHTLYAGIIQTLLALYAFWVVASGSVARYCRHGIERWQIWFWSATAVVSFVLALGRYTPFYRMFYALPLVDTIRCPVKFLHVTNMAIAILAAYGLTCLMLAIGDSNAHSEKGRRVVPDGLRSANIFAIVCGVVAAAFVFGLLAVKASTPAFASYWARLGYPAELHAAMLRQMMAALMRSAWLTAGLAAGVGGAARWSSRWSAGLLGILVCGAVGLDMASVGRRFVHTADLSVHESKNDAILEIKASVAPRVLDLLTSRNSHDPLRVNLRNYYVNTIRLLDVDLEKKPVLLARASGNLQDLTRLLVVTGTEYILGRREQLLPLAKAPEFEAVAGYDFAGRVIRSVSIQRAPITLLRVRNVLPRAAFATQIRSVTNSVALRDVLFSADFDPWHEVLVDDGAATAGLDRILPPSPLLPVAVTKASRYRVDLTADCAAEGLILLNEPFSRDWSARVDGQAATIVQANGAMMAVRVPRGKCTLVFARTPGFLHFFICIMPTILILVGGAGHACLRTFRCMRSARVPSGGAA